MNERILLPVIVKSRDDAYYDKIFRHAVTELSPLASSGLERQTPIRDFINGVEISETMFTQIRSMRKFKMFSMILPREAVKYMSKLDGVSMVYSDEPMIGFGYPVVSEEGVYKIRSKFDPEFKFTSTVWTKELMGGYDANDSGIKGEGQTVAVVDTGGSNRHEQTRRMRFYTELPLQKIDENGHGQWCASCIGGVATIDKTSSRKSGVDIAVEGFAPKCNLIGIKVLGYGIGTGSTSGIISGVQRAMEMKSDVINLSLGGDVPGVLPEDDPQFDVFNQVERAGIIAAVASGNSGPSQGTVNSPGSLPSVLTVGAVDPILGVVAPFSSRGPTPWRDVKPDCVAYGVNVNSGVVGISDSAGDSRPNKYSPLSGTSMATPHVAGLVTLMRQSMKQHNGRSLSTPLLKRMLEKTGPPKNNDSGWGLITWERYKEMEG